MSQSSAFKGLETLKMLEKQLGLEETKVEELKPKQPFSETSFDFYNSEYLATSDNFRPNSKPHNYVFSIQEQYMKQLEDQYKYL